MYLLESIRNACKIVRQNLNIIPSRLWGILAALLSKFWVQLELSLRNPYPKSCVNLLQTYSQSPIRVKFTKDVFGMLVLYLVLSTFSSKTSASVPPGARISHTCSYVDCSETALKMNWTGLLTIFFTAATTSTFRSTTSVVPRDFNSASLCKEAVAMIGGNLDSFANGIAAQW